MSTTSSRANHLSRALTAVLGTFLVLTSAIAAPQRGRSEASAASLPSIEEKTEGMEKQDGFFPLYWDADLGQLWLEIPQTESEFLYVHGLAAGIGSNDIGLDRGQGAGGALVRFERVGRKILMVEPNLSFRADSDNPDERQAVEEAFARSILWGFTAAAETEGRVLVEMTDFLIRDAHGIATRLRPAQYRLDNSRSAIFRERTKSFPKNTEMEVTLTYTTDGPVRGIFGGFGNQPGPGGGFGRGALSAVTPNTSAVTVRQHHSFVELPEEGYHPRLYDPRAGVFALTYQDYATPLGTPLTKRFLSRHRLKKVDPSAAVSDAVKPIVYYLDRGTPEPIRSALLDGARWWNQAFEAAGYRNAFRVEMMPPGADNMDIRYNIIQWVHRSTRGWSYGATVDDPRTGEIIRGVVSLGSLRVRQDYLIAEGLLSPYETGTETPPELAEWALARLRQLSAHEIGHTIGFGHNYWASSRGRISVMDYPHPLVTLNSDGSLDYSAVYDDKIGDWDKVAVEYAYQDFPAGTDETAALRKILDDAWDNDVIYMTNQDQSAHPRVHQWANNTNQADELNRMMQVRRSGLDRFGERAIKLGQPLAELEEVFVPLYLHHRYQVTATASALGGMNYHYALRGDGRGSATERVPAADQRAALNSLLATLAPQELAISENTLSLLPPRPSGYFRHREIFPRYTGSLFDAITPAVVASQHVLAEIFDPSRAARIVQQNALQNGLPGLDEVILTSLDTIAGATAPSPYHAEIRRAVHRVAVEQLMSLAQQAPMPQARAIATSHLRRLHQAARSSSNSDPNEAAYLGLLAADLERFLNRPAEPYSQPSDPRIPPGAPIGQAAESWLDAGWQARQWLNGANGSALPPSTSVLNWLVDTAPLCSMER